MSISIDAVAESCIVLSESGDVTQYILDQGIGYFIISLYKWNNGIWSGHSRYTSFTVSSPILNYNANMGGVDLKDQFRTYCPVGRKSFKWWRCCLWYLFKVSILNAYLLYQSMPRPRGSKSMDHFKFHISIARSLAQGKVARR